MNVGRPVMTPHDVPNDTWEVIFMDETSGFPPWMMPRTFFWDDPSIPNTFVCPDLREAFRTEI